MSNLEDAKKIFYIKNSFEIKTKVPICSMSSVLQIGCLSLVWAPILSNLLSPAHFPPLLPDRNEGNFEDFQTWQWPF